MPSVPAARLASGTALVALAATSTWSFVDGAVRAFAASAPEHGHQLGQTTSALAGLRQPLQRESPSSPTAPLAPAAIFAAAAFAGGALAVSRRRGKAFAAEASGTSVVMVKTPQDTYLDLVKKGESNGATSVMKVLFSSFMGGCYVGMAGLLSLAISGNMTNPSPGVQKFMFASLFPVNLLLVLQSGGQLFTGNTATMTVALIEGKVSKRRVLKIWLTSYIGNVLGAGLIALVAMYTGLLTGGTATLASKVVLTKCSYTFGQTVVKAIMCNWLVCMAVYLAMSAQDLTGKMVGIWFPISMFVAIGFEHSVANMFLLPAGLLSGAPLSIADIVTKNLIPVSIGNMLAGAIVFGAGLAFAFGRLGSGDKGSFRGYLRMMRRGLCRALGCTGCGGQSGC